MGSEMCIRDRGKAVANHFVINTEDGEYLQSYDSIVAHIPTGEKVILGRDWDYSATTLRHLKHYLDVSYSKKEIQGLIDDDVYQLDMFLNLNK